MNLINTGIIPSGNDIFWNNIPASLSLTPKPVLIIINGYEPGSADATQLDKMMEVCRLAPGTHNILQMAHNEQMAWHQLRDVLKPKIVFLIGIMPAQLGISVLFRLHQPNNFNECIWLPALALGELRKNDEARKYLWENGMKPLFVNGDPILAY